MAPASTPRQRRDYFTFKRFHIDQSGCAMRVSSDATIFGAYIPVAGARTLLDIGTGTGVLALMVAQRASPEARIDAVEISPIAFQRARENIAASPFAIMIHTFEQSIQEFARQGHGPYDLIFSNPPFFQNSLASSSSEAAHIARHSHDDGLDFLAMVTAVERLLHAAGMFWVILPNTEHSAFLRVASNAGLYERHRLSLRHSQTSAIRRIISGLSRHDGPLDQRELIRHGSDNLPTEELHQLLVPYMLHY
jgi:tRNA1Val (adenine37-N6)-methyltransferase